MKNLFLSALFLILFAGCLQDDVYFSTDSSTLVFQSEYTNYAWGYNHSGWMMSSSGQAKRFQKSAKWVFPDSLGYVSEVDMQKNLAACDSVIEQISSTTFDTYSAKALTCVNGTLSKPQNLMADAGANIWAFYVYDAGNKRYKRILLNMTGDWSQENLASSSKEITDWMKTIK